MFDAEKIALAILVFVARVCDVSLGTFRHAMIVRGKKLPAFLLAFAESLIWVYAVSRVIAMVTDPLTALAFASGFATGTYVGISIEGLFKIGEQVVRIFSGRGETLAAALRDEGFRVTLFEGSGRDGKVELLFVQTKRRYARRLSALARELDPCCFLVVDDVRDASSVG